LGHYLLYTKSTELWLGVGSLEGKTTQVEQALESLGELVCAIMACIAVSAVMAI
jgi:hypothetical protein